MMGWNMNVMVVFQIQQLFIPHVWDAKIVIACNCIFNILRDCDILIHSKLKVCPGCSWVFLFVFLQENR